MKYKYPLILVAVFLSFSALTNGQTKLSIRVNADNDDLEEYIPGPNQTQTVGNLDAGSSDLELGSEDPGNVAPQVVGVRFNDISIPRGAVILSASIQFTVDNTSKNDDPCSLMIYAEDSDNPLTFDPTTPYNISSRNRLADSIAWMIGASTWGSVGESGADQTTPDISALVQKLIDRSGWASGNSMAFFFEGTGTREAESHDGSPSQAPLLNVTYIAPTVLSVRVNSDNDDLEEYIPGPNQTQTVGNLDAGSSDLELGSEDPGNVAPQLVGVRFNNLNIPKGAIIHDARIQFTVDNTSKNDDPSNLWVYAEAADNPLTYDPTTPYNMSSRPKLADSVQWQIGTGTWNTVGAAGSDEQTPNLATLVQHIVNRDGWAAGNSMSFFIAGSGTREAESHDGSPSQAPLLTVSYFNLAELNISVNADNDDLEEYIPGPNQTQTVGNLDAGSSDLELGSEDPGNVAPQVVGVRFNNINLPQGARIQDAFIQFTVDNNNKNDDPCNIWIYVEDADNPVTFDPTVPYNISSRPRLADSVNWQIGTNTWSIRQEAGPDQRTPDLGRLVQQIVNRPNWTAGNSIVFMFEGTGTREAESYDGSPSEAPKLSIRYLSSGASVNPTTDFPIDMRGSWAYFDKTDVLDASWTSLHFNDTVWSKGNAPLGYGDAVETEISYGGDENNKLISSYFRKRINIDDLSLISDTLDLGLRIDDGAVVYINGTEVVRVNMPTGTITASTTANREVVGSEESAYFLSEIPKTVLISGENIIAVEVHQYSAGSDDLAFDLTLNNRSDRSIPSDIGCLGIDDDHISCFTSLIPRAQDDLMEIPFTTHAFQFLFQEGDDYTGGGKIAGNNDFTGFVQDPQNSGKGWLSVSHENSNASITIADLTLDSAKGLWVVDALNPVDLGPVQGATRLCSGGITPWGTVIVCEEGTSSTDANGDGYHDRGWNIEIDPKTRQVVSYGNGPEKLWAMGKMDHENVVISNDEKTVYFGEDDGAGSVYKFVADEARKLNKGKLYVLKLDAPLSNLDPVSGGASWIMVPNSTPTECNNVETFADAAGTTFGGVEDVEISPIDGKIYFAVKGHGRIYRFTDNGTNISNFETYVGGKNYKVNSGGRVVSEPFGAGIDNLTFDDRGNLYGLQDGGNNYIWMIRPGHTQSNPKVEIFMNTPNGSEPTGMTFSPDFTYMFLSIQHPAGNTDQEDVAGTKRKFNNSTTLVIARNDYLGKELVSVGIDSRSIESIGHLKIYPNPFQGNTTVDLQINDHSNASITLHDMNGRLIEAIQSGILRPGTHQFDLQVPGKGFYFVRVSVNGYSFNEKIISY